MSEKINVKSREIVEGFLFFNEDMAKEARKEAEGVRYVKSKTNMEQPEKVLRIYKKMLDENMFQTQVGYAYLRELQEYLITMPHIAKEDIPPIPVADKVKVEDASGTVEMFKTAEIKLKQRIRNARICILILIVAMIMMFVIAASSNSTTILNYEDRIINKYETWEQQLDEREKKLNQREQELNKALEATDTDADTENDVLTEDTSSDY